MNPALPPPTGTPWRHAWPSAVCGTAAAPSSDGWGQARNSETLNPEGSHDKENPQTLNPQINLATGGARAEV